MLYIYLDIRTYSYVCLCIRENSISVGMSICICVSKYTKPKLEKRYDENELFNGIMVSSNDSDDFIAVYNLLSCHRASFKYRLACLKNYDDSVDDDDDELIRVFFLFIIIFGGSWYFTIDLSSIDIAIRAYSV